MSFIISKSQQREYVGVFCSADNKIPDQFKDTAFALGLALYDEDYGLITGGAESGLMYEVINGYAYRGDSQHMFGILPTILKQHNIHHKKILNNNVIWTQDLYQRLEFFQKNCDAIVVLPGGFGTLHELMDFLVPKQWGVLNKKIILLNIENYWNLLLGQFEVMIKHNTISRSHLDLLQVTSSLEECLEAIQIPEKSYQGLNSRFWT